MKISFCTTNHDVKQIIFHIIHQDQLRFGLVNIPYP